jgi:prevent-host-death family protein
MIREATAMTVRQNLGELLNEIQYRHDQILITKAGKPVAAMVDIELFEKIRLLRGEFDRLVGELGAAYRDVDPAVAHQEIAEAIEAARGK